MRHPTLARRVGSLLTALTLSLPLGSPLVLGDDRAMRDALEAARNREWQKIDQAAIDGHLLAGYVEYHRLRHRLPQAEPAQVLDFIERHADTPLAEWIRGQAIARYGHAGRFGALLAVADGVPEGTARQCYYYTALLGRDPGAAAEGGRELWRVGRSQPDACNTLFRALRERGEIGEREIWERQMLAWEAGEAGLMNYLGRMLGNRWQEANDTVERLRKDYAAVTRVPTCIGPACQGHHDILSTTASNYQRVFCVRYFIRKIVHVLPHPVKFGYGAIPVINWSSCICIYYDVCKLSRAPYRAVTTGIYVVK